MDEGLLIAIFGLTSWIIKQEYTRRRDKKVLDSPDLKHHNLINSYFDSKKSFLRNQWFMSDRGRSIVVRTAMLKKIEIWDKHLTKLANDVDDCLEDCESGNICNKLYAMNMKAFNNANNEYRNFYLNPNKYSAEEIEIFDIFIQEFQKYHTKSIKNVEDYIIRACRNDYITDCKMIQSIIFDNYLNVFNTTFMDMNDSIVKINGRLTGRVINGVKIGEVEENNSPEVEFIIE